MRTRRSGRAPGIALGLALALTTAGGCSALRDTPDGAPADRPGAATSDVPLVEDEARLEAAVRRLLVTRARAVAADDPAAVLRATVDDEQVRRGQRRYVRNLSRLPVQTFRYATRSAVITPQSTADGPRVRVEVDLVLRLTDLDAAGVASPREVVLAVDGRERLRLLSDAPVLDDPSDGGAQPWDTTGVTAVRRSGVLGVFDSGSAGPAEEVVDEAADAADEVGEALPYEWSREVVVYAPSDTALLAALAGLPGGVADALDGVAFPVRSGQGGPVVAERVLLHPRMLSADRVERDRLLRHELVHVALGARDDMVPRWLAEGIAEWVSVQPLPLPQRLISSAALDAARSGVDELPSDETFNTRPRSGANYGIAWQVCEEIVAAYGEEALWTLLEEMGDRGDRDPEDVVREVLGTSGSALAGEAADRIVSAYG